MKRNLANSLTTLRILCSIALLFCPALSPAFYALYALAGITDMIDGTVARKTNTATAFGAVYDTAADFILVAVCLYKLIPVLSLPLWLWIWVGVIALTKAVNLVSGFVMHRKLTVLHTVMNKVTGGLLFVFPFMLSFLDPRYSGAVVCAVATFSAIQEGHFIRTGRT